MRSGDVKIAALLLLLDTSACEYFRGYRREVRLPAPPLEACVRVSLGEVPGVAVYAEGRTDRGFWFNWRAGAQALGSVSVAREGGGAALVLETGWLNSCSPAALAEGRLVMSALYERLRINCGGLPELCTVQEQPIRACGG